MTDLLVLIPTIERRREALITMLQGLALSSLVKSTELVVIDDPSQRSQRQDVIPLTLETSGSVFRFRRFRQITGSRRRAQHWRWFVLTGLEPGLFVDPDQIVLTLDDDFFVGAGYLERTLEAFLRLEADREHVVASWGGFDENYRLVPYLAPSPLKRLVRPQAGCMVFRARTLKGLIGSRWASFLERHHSEELCIAPYLHELDVEMWRLPGESGLKPQACALEPASCHRADFDRWKEQLLAMRAMTDPWPHTEAFWALYNGLQLPRRVS